MHGIDVAWLFQARSSCENGQKTVQHKAGRNNNGVANRRNTLRRRKRVTVTTILGLRTVTQERVLIVGKMMLHLTLFTYASAYLSPQWVCRVYDPAEGPNGRTMGLYHQVNIKDATANSSVLNAKNLYCFGVWTACDDSGLCDDVWNLVLGVQKLVVQWVQILASVVLLGYGAAVLLDAASRLTLCTCLAYNRIVESVLALTAVLHFLTLLYQTGEVKNRAVRVHGLRDVAAWGFALSASSLALAVTSTCLMALFRLTEPAYKHRRFWKMPAELKPRHYLAAIEAGGGGGWGGGGDGGGVVTVKELAGLPSHILGDGPVGDMPAKLP